MDAFIGEIRTWPVLKCPEGWHFCDGTLLPISSNQALFALIGTTYGGDGVNNFALPDLRQRVPVHRGQGTGLTNRPIAFSGGSNTATLDVASMPSHNHTLLATNLPGTTNIPATNNAPAAAPAASNMGYYQTLGHSEVVVPLNVASIGSSGGNLPHMNQMPTIALNYIIATIGNYPVQN